MRSKPGIRAAVLFLLAAALTFTTLAAAEEGNAAISNTISIADLAVLMESPDGTDRELEMVEIVTEGPVGPTHSTEEAPVRSVTLSIAWINGIENAPDLVTAIVAGMDAPLTVELTRENDWRTVAELPDASITPTYSLVEVYEYTVSEAPGQVVFDVSQAFDEAEEEFVIEMLDEEAPQAEDYMVNPSSISVDITLEALRDGVALPAGEPVYLGDTICLSGHLENPDGLPYALQWQCDQGGGWGDISGANDLKWTFPLTEENVLYNFRLMMIVDTAA